MDENPVILWQAGIGRLRFLALCGWAGQNVGYDWRWKGVIVVVLRAVAGECYAEIEHMECKEGSDLECGSLGSPHW